MTTPKTRTPDRTTTTGPTDELLVVDHLGKTYGDHQVLGDINFTVRSGEFLCIVGPSGAGKTTLLQCLSGLIEPTSGSVALRGQKVTEPPAEMAIVFQDYSRSLMPWLSVLDNVALPLRSAKTSKAERIEKAMAALIEVGLEGPRPEVPLAALRRHATARRHRPGPGLRPGDRAHGRAVRLGGRPDPSETSKT